MITTEHWSLEKLIRIFNRYYAGEREQLSAAAQDCGDGIRRLLVMFTDKQVMQHRPTRIETVGEIDKFLKARRAG